MENYIIGSIIKEYRIRLKISQEDLAFGLCAVSTLSRIENGAQVPGRKLVEAFFSKMGMNPPASAIPMSKSDFKRENLEYEINNSIAIGDYDISNMLEEYKNCGKKMDALENQFYIFYKAMSEDILHHDAAKALQQYQEAIKITIKDFEIGKSLNLNFLTRTELLIFNNMARSLYFMNQKDDAIKLMEFLRCYYENGIVSEEEKSKGYLVILLNLENWYGLRGDYKKALALSEKAIDICIKYGKLTSFPIHLFNKGCSLIKLNQEKNGKEFISQAFSIFKSMRKEDEIEYGKRWLLENFNITI